MRTTRKQARFVLFASAFICLFAAAGRAEDFSFAGDFTRDDEVRLFDFTVAPSSVVTLRTTSYAGGGFSPVLSLFSVDVGGLLIDRNNGVDNTGGDAFLQTSLQPGHYVVGLTQYYNLAAGPYLSDGFLVVNDPTFTSVFGGPGATGPFIDPSGSRRAGNFALEIANVTSAATVPEPAALLLLGSGLAGAGAAARHRRRAGKG